MPFLAQQFEEHLKNTLVLFVHMKSYLQLLFDPTRTLCGITSKFTLSRAWDTTVIYLLTLQFKGEILWKTKFKLIVHSWFKDEYRQATGILLERLTIDFLSTKPHTHMYVVLLPLNFPSTPSPPLGSITRWLSLCSLLDRTCELTKTRKSVQQTLSVLRWKAFAR